MIILVNQVCKPPRSADLASASGVGKGRRSELQLSDDGQDFGGGRHRAVALFSSVVGQHVRVAQASRVDK